MFNFNYNFNIAKNNAKRLFLGVLSGSIFLNLFMSRNNANEVLPEETTTAYYYIGPDCSVGRFGRYVASEEDFLLGLKKTEKCKLISLEEKELLDFINQNQLFCIEENRDVINNLISCNREGIDYEYILYTEVLKELLSDGTFAEREIARCSWTQYPNEKYKLTGKTRMVHYIYYGYKIEKDSNGMYILLESNPVKNLEDLPEGYDYVKERFYRVMVEDDFDYDSSVKGKLLVNSDDKPKQKVMKRDI